MADVPARRVEGDDIEELKSPGDFRWTGIDNGVAGRMMFVCPCGCGSICGVILKPAVANGWDWDGNLDTPTLQPSIMINRGHWHGYLTGGVFKTC